MIPDHSIALLVITDGRRDCIEATIASAEANLVGNITRRMIYDDSGDETNRLWLEHTFEGYDVFWHPAGRQGFGGAIRFAWQRLALGRERFVFHLEDDFTFNRPVDLSRNAEVLRMDPGLAQIALRRQAWNDAERAAGGVVEANPDAFCEHRSAWSTMRADGTTEAEDATVLMHRQFFTTNPSLYRSTLCRRGWPKGDQSEGRFSVDLFRDPHVRCAYWGSRSDEPWVHHIGRERAGHGY